MGDGTSPYLFRIIGDGILGRMVNGSRGFVALFGIPPLKVYQLWQLIDDGHKRDKKYLPKHLMWALLLLRTYNREEVLATLVGVTEKTYRKWAWMMIQEIAAIDSLVSVVCPIDVAWILNQSYC
jgi:hypothetical protein